MADKLNERLLSTYHYVAKAYGNVNAGVLIRDFVVHKHTIHLVKKYAPRATHNNKILDVSAGFAIPSRILQEDGYDVQVTDSPAIAGEDVCQITKNCFPLTYINNLETDDLPFQENTFDVVLWLATIEHIQNSPKRILLWIHKILKEKGVIIINTPNILELRKRLMMLCGRSIAPPIKFVFNSEYNADHHREYTLKELEYVMKNTGFNILYAQAIDTISGLSLQKRMKREERNEKDSQLGQMSQFSLGWHLFNVYDWLRLPLFLLCKFFPNIRDTLFIVGQK